MILEHLASRVENLMTVKVWLEWLLSFSELRLLDTMKRMKQYITLSFVSLYYFKTFYLCVFKCVSTLPCTKRLVEDVRSFPLAIHLIALRLSLNQKPTISTKQARLLGIPEKLPASQPSVLRLQTCAAIPISFH